MDKLDLEMAFTEEETKSIEEATLGKVWRALRVASKTNLGKIDEIDDGRNLQVLVSAEIGANGAGEDNSNSPGTVNGKVETSVDDNADEEGNEEPRPASKTE